MSPVLCPYCARPHDVRLRVTGDVVLCAGCGGWFQVQHALDGRSRAKPHTPPPEPPTIYVVWGNIDGMAWPVCAHVDAVQAQALAARLGERYQVMAIPLYQEVS